MATRGEQKTPRPGTPPPVAAVVEAMAPWKPPKYEDHIPTAFQALLRGDCPAHLQQAVLRWLIWDLCGTYDMAYRPGGPEGERDTGFALGKQFVGQQIVKLVNIRVNKGGEQG